MQRLETDRDRESPDAYIRRIPKIATPRNNSATGHASSREKGVVEALAYSFIVQACLIRRRQTTEARCCATTSHTAVRCALEFRPRTFHTRRWLLLISLLVWRPACRRTLLRRRRVLPGVAMQREQHPHRAPSGGRGKFRERLMEVGVDSRVRRRVGWHRAAIPFI